MKYFLFVYVVAGIFSVASRASIALPEEIDVEIQRVFVPIGFDNNDKTQVVATGSLPGTCYKVSNFTVTKLGDGKLGLQQKALKYTAEGCIEAPIPYQQVMDIGVIEEGIHLLVDMTTQKEVGKLPVSRAPTALPDDYIYAPVSDVMILKPKFGPPQLRVQGTIPVDCLKFSKIDVYYYGDVIVAQPILDVVVPLISCHETPIEFDKRVVLKEGLQGRHLVHVRSMEGNAVNKIVSFIRGE